MKQAKETQAENEMYGKHLAAMMFNAQSIRNKMDVFRALIAKEKPDIIGIMETWIHTNTRDYIEEYNVHGYKLFKKDRIHKEGGGVLLYIREFFNAKAGQCSFDNLPLPSLPLSLLGPVTTASWFPFLLDLSLQLRFYCHHYYYFFVW